VSTAGDLPRIFCWTRFGTEAGETIDAILERKERERRQTDGLFLWGIGNSIAPAVQELVRQAAQPEVLFSAIKSPPRAVDVAPMWIHEFRTAVTLDGVRLELPPTIHVRAGGPGHGGRPRYALVCRSSEALRPRKLGELEFGSLGNLLSGRPLGSSQVTAVVTRSRTSEAAERRYVVALRADLVWPYFVRLTDAVPIRSSDPPRSGSALLPRVAAEAVNQLGGVSPEPRPEADNPTTDPRPSRSWLLAQR